MAREQVNTDSAQQLENKSVVASGGSEPRTLEAHFGTFRTPLDFAGGFTSGAIQAAVSSAASAGGGTVVLPPGTYSCTTSISGFGNRVGILAMDGATLSKEFNGDLFDLDNAPLYNTFKDVYVDANGDVFTGSVMRIRAGCQGTKIDHMIVVDGADTIITIEPDGGSAMWLGGGSIFTIHANNTATGAVIKNTGADTQATPRTWTDCFGLSNTWFYRGTGLQSFYASEIYSRGFHFTGATSGGCRLTGCRMALFPQASSSLELRGENMIVSDCLFGGDFTIGSDFSNSKFKGNIMDTAYTLTNNAPLTSLIESPRTPFYQLGIKTIDTAQLPAASADMNNVLIFENAGIGNRNLIEYANSQRFRIDGGANV